MSTEEQQIAWIQLTEITISESNQIIRENPTYPWNADAKNIIKELPLIETTVNDAKQNKPNARQKFFSSRMSEVPFMLINSIIKPIYLYKSPNSAFVQLTTKEKQAIQAYIDTLKTLQYELDNNLKAKDIEWNDSEKNAIQQLPKTIYDLETKLQNGWPNNANNFVSYYIITRTGRGLFDSYSEMLKKIPKTVTPTTTYTVDARIPVSSDVSTKDPAHPQNVIGDLTATQNQAAADTKYDAFPPKRIEGFAQDYSINIYLIIFSAFFFLLYGVYTTPILAGSNAQQTFHFFFFVWIVGMALMFVTRFIRI